MTYVASGAVAELPAAPQQQGGVAVVGVAERPGAGAVPGLDPHQGLEPAQRGRRLPPHRLPADQRLQTHQALERAQRTPSLQRTQTPVRDMDHGCVAQNGSIRMEFERKKN